MGLMWNIRSIYHVSIFSVIYQISIMYLSFIYHVSVFSVIYHRSIMYLYHVSIIDQLLLAIIANDQLHYYRTQSNTMLYYKACICICLLQFFWLKLLLHIKAAISLAPSHGQCCFVPHTCCQQAWSQGSHHFPKGRLSDPWQQNLCLL